MQAPNNGHVLGKTPAHILACAAAAALFLLIDLSLPARAEKNNDLVQCESIVSLEQRLTMERWARPGGCERPLRARFTDRFLGFACTTADPADRCHAFLPGRDSGAFDTSQVYRCVDVALTEGDGVRVSRLREWAGTPTQCDWDRAMGTLAMEVDFDNDQVCVGASCMAVDRLTPIGKARLRRLVTSALRELGLMAHARGTHTISPVQARIDQTRLDTSPGE